MYEAFFGFRERPFDLTPDPRYLVLTDSHREALSNLEYGIASRKGITLLIGEAGSGKTTVIRTAISRQPVRVHCVHLHNPTLTRGEFAEMLAVRYELSARARQSKTAMLVELENLLRERLAEGETSVLVVDEAQSLPLELLEEIRLLANVETDHGKLLSVVVAGQPELAARLNQPELRQLKQRIALRCELRPLSLVETRAYVDGRIRAAGGPRTEVFTRDAVALIHDRAHGIPRSISVIADNALLGGFAAQIKPVTSEIVRDVCRDFDLEQVRSEVDAERQDVVSQHVPDYESMARQLTAAPQVNGAADGATGPVAAPAEARPVGGEFLASFYPKRKRFSFFRS